MNSQFASIAQGATKACRRLGSACTMRIAYAALLAVPPAFAADFAAIKAGVMRATGGVIAPDEVRATAVESLFEVRVGTELMYVDETGRYAMVEGHLVDLASRKDFTQARMDEIRAVRFSSLPLEHAIKIVRGKGSRVVALFEDPECVYCQKVHKFLDAQTDVTIYAFPIPTTSSRPAAEAAWCAPDRAAAWTRLMTRGEATGAGGCATSIDAVIDWARARGINGTPTLFFADGSRVDGAPDPRDLLAKLNTSRLSK